MESNVRKLYLVDEFDRVYKQLQRPAQAVTDINKSDDGDDECEEEEVFISPPLRYKKKRKVDDADWSRYIQKGKQK